MKRITALLALVMTAGALMAIDSFPAAAKFLGGIYTDTISEVTSGSGVTIDSVLLKDGGVTATGNIVKSGANGQAVNIKIATQALTGLSGATAATTSLVTGAAIPLGCSVRVTTEITGASAFTIGDGSDADRWGTGIALAAGTTTDMSDFTATAIAVDVNGFDVTLTATTSDFTAGAVRVACAYIDLTAPTS